MELLNPKEATKLITTCISHYHTLELILDIWVLSTYKFACAQHDFSLSFFLFERTVRALT